ncbi:hypothetical protein [Dysgonomonas termitidis]|uniref:Uncharacterized protein n=1 Tax=Dysgonomonas termitidis TaxID=1516126 RepID=A0ABV9KUF8_9BACT
MYNEKRFLLPQSPNSMACYHAKIDADGKMKLTIHDCNNSIRLHNDLSAVSGVREALDKLAALEAGIADLKMYIIDNQNRWL